MNCRFELKSSAAVVSSILSVVSKAMFAVTTGVAAYGCSKVTVTRRSPSLMRAKPAVSLLKSGGRVNSTGAAERHRCRRADESGQAGKVAARRRREAVKRVRAEQRFEHGHAAVYGRDARGQSAMAVWFSATAFARVFMALAVSVKACWPVVCSWAKVFIWSVISWMPERSVISISFAVTLPANVHCRESRK